MRRNVKIKLGGIGNSSCIGRVTCSSPDSLIKRQGKKMILVLLCVIFAVSAFMTVTASAATERQDGVEAELTFSKTEYKTGEDLDATLTVTSHNPYPVHNVQTKIVLPEGMKLASGSLPSKAFTLAANETKTYKATLVKEAVPDTPKKGSDQGTGSNSSKTVKTSDDSNTGIFIALMLLSGGVLVFVMVRRKRHHGKGVIPFILCFIVLGAVMLPMTADAAGKQKEFTVGQTVKVDGKEVTVKAVISYDHVVHSSVTVNGGTVDNGTGTGIYAEGETVTITAKNPDPAGQHFSGWTVVSGGVVLADSTKETTTFKMPANNVEITADYTVNVYTIEATAGPGGKISTESPTVNYGGRQEFTITPNGNGHIVDVMVDGNSVGAKTTYTFTDVKENHTISATFAIAIDAGSMSPDQLENTIADALNNGFTDIIINGDLSVDQQNVAGEALREWGRGGLGLRDGTISLTLSDVIQVSDKAFRSDGGDEPVLKSINLPKATTVGAEAFRGQNNLENVNVPEVETVGDAAFQACGVKNVELPKATTLKTEAFLGCLSLESVTAPNVTTVHYNALSTCLNLTSLTFKRDMASWGGWVLDEDTAKNITITLASDQKVLSGGDNRDKNSIWKPDGSGAIVNFDSGKSFCGYEFKEIKKAE